MVRDRKAYHAAYHKINRTRVNARNAAWNRANPDKYKAINDRAYVARRAIINRSKAVPCLRCRIQYNPWVMQFDHRDPVAKLFTIGKGNHSQSDLAAEIAKCDVLCANCHAERTHEQQTGVYHAASR